MAQAKRLKQLEDENRRLKRIVADLTGPRAHAGGRGSRGLPDPSWHPEAGQDEGRRRAEAREADVVPVGPGGGPPPTVLDLAALVEP